MLKELKQPIGEIPFIVIEVVQLHLFCMYG